MPKFKDFYTKLKEQGKINNPDFDTFIASLPDTDVPDSVVKSFEDSFFTLERAAAHKDIHGKIKREVLDPVDNELADLFENQLKPYLDPMLEAELKKDGNSYNKLKNLKKLIPDIIEKVKAKPAADDETKAKLKAYEDNIQELTNKFTKAEKTYNEQLSAQKAESEKSFHDFKLDSELQSLGNKFTLAEAYEQNRAAITKVLMSDLKAHNVLKLGEKDGQAEIHILDESGKPKFNGNSPVTITSLLEEKYKPFLKQSGGGTGGQATERQQQSSQQSRQNAPRQGTRTTVQ